MIKKNSQASQHTLSIPQVIVLSWHLARTPSSCHSHKQCVEVTSFYQMTHFPNEKVSDSLQNKTKTQDLTGGPSVNLTVTSIHISHYSSTEGPHSGETRILPGAAGASFGPPSVFSVGASHRPLQLLRSCSATHCFIGLTPPSQLSEGTVTGRPCFLIPPEFPMYWLRGFHDLPQLFLRITSYKENRSFLRRTKLPLKITSEERSVTETNRGDCR